MLLAISILRETRRRLRQGTDRQIAPTSHVFLDNKPAGCLSVLSLGMLGSPTAAFPQQQDVGFLLAVVFKAIY